MTDAGKLADELGKAFYLARYEKDGGIWNANDHKILWIRMAEDYERRTAALRTPPTGNAMREALPRPLTQSETASLRQDAISTSMQMKALMKEPQQQREERTYFIGDEAISLSTAVDAELAKALDASPQEQREDVQPVAWQPIETAPEHERAMFAYRTNLGDWHIELFMGSYFPTQLGYSHWQPLPLPPSQSAPPPLPKRNLND